MKYALAILLPPLAVWLYGRRLQFLSNIMLTCCFWIPGMVQALLVVKNHLADCRRTDRVIAGIQGKGIDHRSFRLSKF